MFKLRRIGPRGVDLELATGRDVTLRILERPGLWMDEVRRSRLLAELREVAGRGTHGGSLVYGILSGSKERWDRTILTVLRAADSGRMVGFSAMSLLRVRRGPRTEEVLHLGLVMMEPGYRGRGFTRLVYGMSLVLALLRRGGRSFWVSNVSQVPAVVGIVAESLEDVHPAPHSRPDPEHRAVAREIMKHHRGAFGVGEDAGFDDRRFVITDAYTGGSDHLKKTYFEAPKHRDSEVNAWCRRELDYLRGDDFLQIARFTPRVAWRCFYRFLTRNSAWASTMRGLEALLGGRP